MYWIASGRGLELEWGFIRKYLYCCGWSQDKMKVMKVSKKLTLMVWLLETELPT